MANAIFRGDAVAIAQVTRVTPGTVVAGNTYSLKINGKVVSVVAETDDPADLVELLVDAVSATLIAEFQEIDAEADGDSLLLTSREQGVPFVVTSLSGDFETDEYQIVTVSNATGGTFPLTYHYLDDLGVEQTETTGAIAYNASAATVETELTGLTHIGSGNAEVTGDNGGPWTVHFTGNLARTDVLPLTSTRASLTGGNVELEVSTIQVAVAGTDEVQTVTLYGTPSGGTFLLSFRGVPSATIAYNASAATLESTLEAVSTIGTGNVNVAGSAGGPWTITFAVALGHRAVEELVIDCSGLTGGTIFATTATTTEGSAAVNQINYVYHVDTDDVQAIVYVKKTSFSSWSAGGWTIKFNSGSTSALIPYDATDAEIAAIIETNLGKNGVIVTSIATQIGIYLVGPNYEKYLSSVTVTSAITGGSVSLQGFTSGVSNADWTVDGTYKFRRGSVDSVLVNRTDSIATIQAALNGMSNVGPGNSLVTALEASGSLYTQQGLYKIELTGALSGTSVSLQVIDVEHGGYNTLIETSVYQKAVATGAANEIQTLTISGSPSTGTFNLIYGGIYTVDIAYNATSSDVQAALETNPGIGPGGVVCTGGPLPGTAVTMTFGGNLSYTDVLQIEVDDSNLKGSVVETTPGVTGTNEIQRLSIAGQNVWGGTLTLTHTIGGGDTTAAIDWNDSATDIANALIATAGIAAGDVVGTGGPFPESYVDIEFTNTLAETNVGQLTGTVTSLKNGDVTIAVYDPMIVDTVTNATGPNHWNDNTNWTTGRVPDWGDSVTLTDGDTDLFYGLRQVSTFTVDTVTDQVIPAGCDLIVGQKVRVWTTNALPAGLSANTDYYITEIDSVTGKLKLSATAGGSTINITGSGTGTHYIGVRLSAVAPLPCFFQDSRWTGQLGLPERNANGYWENRPRYLVVGVDPAGSMTFVIGQGPGSGSGLVRINTGTDQVALEILDSAGTLEQNAPAVNWIGVNTANVINVYGGDFGAAYFADEAATINRLNERAGEVILGNVTFAGTSPMLDKTGGELVTRDQATLSGVLRLRG